MIIDLLRWWYGTGWMQAVHRVGSWTSHVEQTFSTVTLVRTLFAPWRRIVSAGGRSFDAKLRNAMDNIVSRCVGAVVRTFVLLAAGVAGLVTLLIGVLMVIMWPLLPVAICYFLLRSITG